MIVVMNRIPVMPDYTAAFEERFQDRAALVDKMPGFVSYQLLRPTKEGDPYIVMTFWQSQADFEAWTHSPEFREGHSRSGQLPREAFGGHPKLEVHEIIQQAVAGEVILADKSTAPS